MEQQESPPCTPSTIKRESRPLRARVPSPSPTPRQTPNTPAPASHNPLSASEPTLRFPRPQGNRRLANWISASNPDIMRVMSSDDSGLSDSTYELITGIDTESQDGNYAESISGSIASLELHRPDDADVFSLAGTENTYDDETESVADSDVFVQLPPDSQGEEADGQQHDTLILNQGNPAAPGDDGQEQTPEPDHEPSSQPSIEYTRQNLSTPSIATPEASSIVEKPPSTKPTPAGDGEEPRTGRLATLWAMFNDWRQTVASWDRPYDDNSWAIAAKLLLLVVSLVVSNIIFGVFSSPEANTPAPHIPAAVSSSTAFSSTQRPLATSGVTSGLLPVDTGASDEWSFTTKKSEFYITKGQGHYVISAVPKIKYQCLSVTAQRGDEPINLSTAPADNGILVGFPYNESFGFVTVKIRSKCRPRTHKTFEVLFPERGIVEGALEMARNIAHDVSEGVPAVAQEAERRLEEARRSLESASGRITSASNGVLQDLSARFHKAHRSLGPLKAQALQRLEEVKEETSKRISYLTEPLFEKLPDRQDVRDMAELNLLNAQLSAKVWWLKKTGSKEEHDEYKRKAVAHYNSRLAQATHAHGERRYLRRFEQESWLHPEVWGRVFREARCRSQMGKGRSGTNQCRCRA